MTWVLFSILAGIFFTSQGLLSRKLLKGEKDPWAYSFYFSLIGALVSFPFMLAAPTIPLDWHPWLIVLMVGIIIVINNWLEFKAFHHIEASVSGSILKLRLVWVFLLGAFFLQEAVTWEKLIGIALTLAAGILILQKFKQPKSLKGIGMVLAASVLNAGIIILIKYLFNFFNTGSLTSLWHF